MDFLKLVISDYFTMASVLSGLVLILILTCVNVNNRFVALGCMIAMFGIVSCALSLTTDEWFMLNEYFHKEFDPFVVMCSITAVGISLFSIWIVPRNVSLKLYASLISGTPWDTWEEQGFEYAKSGATSKIAIDATNEFQRSSFNTGILRYNKQSGADIPPLNAPGYQLSAGEAFSPIWDGGDYKKLADAAAFRAAFALSGVGGLKNLTGLTKSEKNIIKDLVAYQLCKKADPNELPRSEARTSPGEIPGSEMIIADYGELPANAIMDMALGRAYASLRVNTGIGTGKIMPEVFHIPDAPSVYWQDIFKDVLAASLEDRRLKSGEPMHIYNVKHKQASSKALNCGKYA